MANSKPILYLHMGIYKTGSTAFQKYIWENKEDLLRQGLYIPPFFDGVKGKHFYQMSSILKEEISATEYAEQLAAEMREKKANKAILTDEGWIEHFQKIEKFGGLKEYFDVKAIICLREQSAWLESWYLQCVCRQWNRKFIDISYAEFLSEADKGAFPWLDYYHVFQHIENILGENCIIPIVYDKETINRGFVFEILRHMDINVKGLKKKETKGVNSHNFHRISNIFRYIDLNQFSLENRILVEHFLGNRSSELNSSKVTITSDEIRKNYKEKYRKSNNLVAKKYFKKEELFNDAPSALPFFDSAEENFELYFKEFAIPLIMSLLNGKKTEENTERELHRAVIDKANISKNMKVIENKYVELEAQYKELLKRDNSRTYHFKKLLGLFFSK